MSEDKKQERERQLAESLKKEKNEKIFGVIRRTGLWVGVFAVMAGMIWGLAKLGSQPVPAETGALSEPLNASDHSKGNSLARVVLIEYSDFQCPACSLFYPVLKQAEQKYSKDVLFVYRHFPLPSHDKSNIAAQASEAAAIQGKFWEMHDKLFENQNTWSKNNNAESLFVEYAGQLGLDKEKFKADLKSSVVKDRIEKDVLSGTSSKIDGTPTFFLNGNKLKITTYGDIDSAIADALKQK